MKKLALTLLSVFVLAGAIRAENAATNAIPYFLQPYAEQYKQSPRQATLAWFENARMGMFIHWGVWGKYNSAWSMFNKNIPLEEYKKTAHEVTASGFNAEEIVKLAEESGMHYITFVAKHHDGFCLWDSQYTDFDSKDYFNRDLLAELVKACHEHGMPLCIYYSIGIDWTHPYFLPRELYSVGRPKYDAAGNAYFKYRVPEDFENYRTFCKQQLAELSTKYGPVAGFWFDPLGGVLANSEMFKLQEMYDVIRQLQPQALIHFKTGATGTEDILVGERSLAPISSFYKGDSPQNKRIRELSDAAWKANFRKKAEIAVTSQGPWEWSPTVTCRPADGLWKMLLIAADNNANLLLNFGPKPDGSIPDDVATNFRQLGERIRKEGYPPLNKTTYLEKRQKGVVADDTEKEKTAR